LHIYDGAEITLFDSTNRDTLGKAQAHLYLNDFIEEDMDGWPF
jgi:hypothetical protein